MFGSKQHIERDRVETYKEESMNGTFRFLNRDGWDRTSILRFRPLGTNYLDAASLPSEAYERRSLRKKAITQEIKTSQIETNQTEENAKAVSLGDLFRYSKRNEKVLICFGCVCGAIAGLGIPASLVLFGRLTNTFVYQGTNVTVNNSESELPFKRGNFDEELAEFGVAMTVLGVLHLLFSYLMVVCLNIAAEKQIFRIRTLFLKSVLRQNIGWYDTNKSGDFATTSVENLSKLRDGIGEKIGMSVFFVSNFIASIIVALAYGWKLTLVILSVTPILIAATAIFSKMQNSLTDQEMKAYSKAGVVCEEALSSIRTVVAFGGEDKAVENYKSKLVQAKTTGKKRGLISAIGNGIAWFISYASYSIAFWYGIKLIFESQDDKTFEYDPSVLIIVFFCAIFGSLNVGQLGPYLESISMARASAATVYEIIEREPPIDSSSSEGKKLPTFQGAVEFKDIHFSYPSRPDIQILNGVSLEIKPGETVALVGSSGCGKSTLIQLVQRFYDPHRGEVCVDGYDVKQLNLKWLRDKIGVVGQEPILFGMSIKENIRLGRDNVTDEEMINAAKAANAHDFIKKLPLKYDTLVGERGAQLSGGQKQRIAIARALVKDPRILLLDEATSALDTHSEAKVQAALDAAGNGRTTIIVAHRLSTVQNANRIIALQKGKVVEIGTHSELMAKKGFYFQLVQSQIKPEDEEKDQSESDDEIISDQRKSVRLVRAVSSVKGQTLSVTGTNTEVEYEDDFENMKPSLLRIMKMNAKEWPQILVGCIGSLGFGCTTPCYALLFGEIMRVLSITDHTRASEESIFYSCLFLAIGAWAGICTFLQIYMFASAGEQLTMRLRRLTFEAILHQDISWFDSPKNSTGALCARLATDASNVQGATGSRIGTLLQVFGSLGLAITLALVLVWKQALVSMTLIPLVFVGTYFEGKLVKGQSVSDMKALEEAGKIATEAISNIRTIASLCKETTFLEMYNEAILKTQKQLNRRMHVHGLLFGFAQAVPTFSYALSLTYGGYLIKNENVKYEDVFKVGELLIFGVMMLGQSIAFAPNYNKGLISASRIFSLLDNVPSIDSSGKSGIVPDKKTTDIEFRHVKFTYPTRPGVRILNDFNCNIGHGKTVALVGSSGCGKSTCIQLLERFYDSADGTVVFGNTEIRDINVKWLRRQLGLVSQEPILFDCSISQNIAYGDNSREVGMNEIIDAAKKANIHNFVTSLPLGYDTNVGSKGTQLSGGQKQRIAIARALIRNPKILLLDEATSALDTESEKIVQEALDHAMIGRTCIMIAHRLTTVQKADCILFVHNGKVVEQGTHQQLLAKRGLYYKLHSTSSNRQG